MNEGTAACALREASGDCEKEVRQLAGRVQPEARGPLEYCMSCHALTRQAPVEGTATQARGRVSHSKR